MRAYLQSIWVKVGVGLLLVGATPLVFIAAAALGLWPDPIPNPVGPGLLFYFTFWPAIICIVIEVIRGRIRTVVRPNPVLFGADGALCREIAALREALA